MAPVVTDAATGCPPAATTPASDPRSRNAVNLTIAPTLHGFENCRRQGDRNPRPAPLIRNSNPAAMGLHHRLYQGQPQPMSGGLFAFFKAFKCLVAHLGRKSRTVVADDQLSRRLIPAHFDQNAAAFRQMREFIIQEIPDDAIEQRGISIDHDPLLEVSLQMMM